MNRDKSFKKYSLKSINGLRHYKTAIEKNAIGSYIIWQFSETMKLHSRLLPPPSNCRPLLNILLAFTMVKKKKKKSNELWDASYSGGEVLNRTAVQRPGKNALPSENKELFVRKK